jgi:hypothetical protein
VPELKLSSRVNAASAVLAPSPRGRSKARIDEAPQCRVLGKGFMSFLVLTGLALAGISQMARQGVPFGLRRNNTELGGAMKTPGIPRFGKRLPNSAVLHLRALVGPVGILTFIFPGVSPCLGSFKVTMIGLTALGVGWKVGHGEAVGI